MNKLFSTGILIALTSLVFSQASNFNCYVDDEKGATREHNVDLISLNLAVSFIPEDGKVSGTANYIFVPIQQKVDSVFLDAPGILIQDILLNDQRTKFRMDSAGVTVYFNPPLKRSESYRLMISYDAYPKRGIYFNGWNNEVTDSRTDPTIIRKQIWTQGQGIDNRNWIPSYDGVNDKLITSLTITFKSDYTVISNGDHDGPVINGDGTSTWKFTMPHPHALYLIMVAIGKYDQLDYQSLNGIKIIQYYYPGTKNIAEYTYKYSAEIMDFLESETGSKYPWTGYSNIPVQEFLYGAMENTTATIFSDYYYQDERAYPEKNYTDINAHELTHQWFGDYVSAWNNAGTWLQESFATYYAKKFRESISGDDVYQWKRREEMNAAFELDAKNDLPVAHSQAGSARVYQKGSFVLDMLRYVTGDEQFKIVIKDYLARYPYQNVETNDFQMQFMRSLGINNNWFFDEWIYRTGFPEYTVSYTSGAGSININVKQTQKQTETVHLFKMPVHIQVHYKNGSFDDKLVWIENEETNIIFTNNANDEIAFILFDPNSMIYAKVNFIRSPEEIRLQAFNAPNMMDRYDAIVLMRTMETDKKRNDLITIYKKENFYGIKNEIIAQLSNDDDKHSQELLLSALKDPLPSVRKAVASNLQSISSRLEKEMESMLGDVNYFNAELALTQLCKYNPTKKSKYLDATKNIKGSNNNFRITWLKLMIADGATEYANELVEFTGPNYEFRTRTYAMNALVELKYFNAAAAQNLFNAALSVNGRLSGPARNALLKFKEDVAYKTIIDDYYKSQLWDEWQINQLKPVTGQP